MVAGRVNLNTRRPPVLKAILAGSYADELDLTGASTISATDADALAVALVERTTSAAAGKGPLANISELVGRWNSSINASQGGIDGRQSYTGFTADLGTVFVGILLMFVLPVAALTVATLLTPWDIPALRGFNYRGGFVLVPEFVALFAALTTYTAAFIAEIVRGGIMAVPKGQIEAAGAVGLRPGQTLRLVVIPQALRVMIPPMTSQYLNVLKNSSFGAAIAFPELVSVFMGSALNNTGQAIEIIAITLGVYLAIGLAVSALMNWYNARMALVTR